MTRANVLLAIAVMATPGGAVGQDIPDSFAQLEQQQMLRQGDNVSVAYLAECGAPTCEIKAWFLGVNDSSLTVLAGAEELSIQRDSVQQITRERRGPLWNGLLIGAATGVTAQILYSRDIPDSRGDLHEITLCAGLGAGVGMVIDALFKEEKVVYRRPGGAAAPLRIDASPLLSSRRRGVLLSLRW